MGVRDYVESKVRQLKHYQQRQYIKKSLAEKARFEKLESDAKHARFELKKRKLEKKYRKDIDRANRSEPRYPDDDPFGGSLFFGGSSDARPRRSPKKKSSGNVKRRRLQRDSDNPFRFGGI